MGGYSTDEDLGERKAPWQSQPRDAAPRLKDGVKGWAEAKCSELTGGSPTCFGDMLAIGREKAWEKCSCKQNQGQGLSDGSHVLDKYSTSTCFNQALQGMGGNS